MTLWKASSVVLARAGMLVMDRDANIAVAAIVTLVRLVSKRTYVDRLDLSVNDLKGTESR